MVPTLSSSIYLDGTIYKDWINSKFTLVHKSILVITQSCTRNSEQGIWIRLID